jgi:hypothetical protein
MANSSHLWAVGYDDMGRANQVRDEIISLGWDKHCLLLDDVAGSCDTPTDRSRSTKNRSRPRPTYWGAAWRASSQAWYSVPR